MQEIRSSLIKHYCLPIMTSQCSGCLSLENVCIRRIANEDLSSQIAWFHYERHRFFSLDCGGRISLADDAVGIIESPDFDSGSYNHSTECIWIVGGSSLQRTISLQFLNLSLEDHGECNYDMVEIREGKIPYLKIPRFGLKSRK